MPWRQWHQSKWRGTTAEWGNKMQINQPGCWGNFQPDLCIHIIPGASIWNVNHLLIVCLGSPVHISMWGKKHPTSVFLRSINPGMIFKTSSLLHDQWGYQSYKPMCTPVEAKQHSMPCFAIQAKGVVWIWDARDGTWASNAFPKVAKY